MKFFFLSLVISHTQTHSPTPTYQFVHMTHIPFFFSPSQNQSNQMSTLAHKTVYVDIHFTHEDPVLPGAFLLFENKCKYTHTFMYVFKKLRRGLNLRIPIFCVFFSIAWSPFFFRIETFTPVLFLSRAWILVHQFICHSHSNLIICVCFQEWRLTPLH